MNCKPGDLAICINAVVKEHIGLIVLVVGPALDRQPGWWTVEVPNHPSPNDLGWRARDSSLRPIRDPGEDATDETLTWLPVPSRERDTA